MIHKKIDFSEITFVFSLTLCEKGGFRKPHPGMIFKKNFCSMFAY